MKCEKLSKIKVYFQKDYEIKTQYKCDKILPKLLNLKIIGKHKLAHNNDFKINP